RPAGLSTRSTLARGTGKLVLAAVADAEGAAGAADAAPPVELSLSAREHATTDAAIRLPTTMAISLEKERMIPSSSKERTYHRGTTPRKSRERERRDRHDATKTVTPVRGVVAISLY